MCFSRRVYQPDGYISGNLTHLKHLRPDSLPLKSAEQLAHKAQVTYTLCSRNADKVRGDSIKVRGDSILMQTPFFCILAMVVGSQQVG